VPALNYIGDLCGELAYFLSEEVMMSGAVECSHSLSDCAGQLGSYSPGHLRICSWTNQDFVNYELLQQLIRKYGGNVIDVETLVRWCVNFVPGQAANVVPIAPGSFSSMCSVVKSANGLRYGKYTAWEAATGAVYGLSIVASNVQIASNFIFINDPWKSDRGVPPM
jgi:hypothetical protein